MKKKTQKDTTQYIKTHFKRVARVKRPRLLLLISVFITNRLF